MYKTCVRLCTFIIVLTASVCAHAQSVIVSGECVGVKFYTDGLLVTDTVPVTDSEGNEIDVSKMYNIKKGDIIKKVNGKDAIGSETIVSALKNNGNITLSINRDGEMKDLSVKPVMTKNGPKLGLWLRDSTAGLGTITCIKDNSFIALGHGICDIDTGNIMPLRKGIIQSCSKIEITKGRPGAPGAITGNIDGKTIGTITKNTPFGITGQLTFTGTRQETEIAKPHEVRTGNAHILADVDGAGVKEYSIQIKRIAPPSNSSKDMVIEITDNELIEKTGGIIQGMSGAPILQNGKLVGAVTHVLVNDPTRGYGIFIENMLEF